MTGADMRENWIPDDLQSVAAAGNGEILELTIAAIREHRRLLGEVQALYSRIQSVGSDKELQKAYKQAVRSHDTH